jgi:hypothetical protein
MLVDTERLPSMDEVFPFEAHLGESLVSGHGRVACVERYACNDGSAWFRAGVEFTQLSDRCRELLDH